jgi:hypothetical protein
MILQQSCITSLDNLNHFWLLYHLVQLSFHLQQAFTPNFSSRLSNFHEFFRNLHGSFYFTVTDFLHLVLGLKVLRFLLQVFISMIGNTSLPLLYLE